MSNALVERRLAVLLAADAASHSRPIGADERIRRIFQLCPRHHDLIAALRQLLVGLILLGSAGAASAGAAYPVRREQVFVYA